MKVNWGKIQLYTKEADMGKGLAELIVDTEPSGGTTRCGWCHLTKSQAVKLGERLIEWGSKE